MMNVLKILSIVFALMVFSPSLANTIPADQIDAVTIVDTDIITAPEDDDLTVITDVVDVLYAGTPNAPKHANGVSRTDPDITLSPDRSELIRLGVDVASVIVGNPQHLSVLVENNRTLVLVPQAAGATYISILDKDSNIIMQRHVIVAAPKDNYIRIRRSCIGGDSKTCKQTQVYYCPGACHEIGLVTEPQAATNDAGAGDNMNADAGQINAIPPNADVE